MPGIKLSTLKLNENNPRHISEEKLEQLKRSIKGFEKMMSLRPIVVNSDNVILGGNMRFRALQELGYKTIPKEWVKVADGLTEAEQREFQIKDNVGFGFWDYTALKDDWDAEDLKEWGLDLFDDVELDPQPQQPSEQKNKIVLEYTDEEHHAITARFNELPGTKEQIVWELLMDKTQHNENAQQADSATPKKKEIALQAGRL